jgi:hypothetical protein
MASLEERVTAIEGRLGMESGLRAAVDRDVADLTQSVAAANHMIQALAITQGQHTTKIEQILATQGEHTAGIQQILTLLNRLIERGD